MLKTAPLKEEVLQAREMADVADIEQLAEWLDSRFRIPGLGWRFGFDTLIGLVPGIGDAITGALGLYIIGRAHQVGASPWLMTRMGWNVLIDTLLGVIPLVGDLFDLGFKSNAKNVRLLLRDLERRGVYVPRPTGRETR